ncbi:MAG: hypothetical protein VW238_04115 [Nitrosomonadales bacterium]|jgi:uncharacterized membrane protein (DUF485 family)
MALDSRGKKELDKKNKRLAIILGLVALFFYIYFILSYALNK